MKDSGLFTLPCRLGDSKPFDTLANLGSCVNLIPLYLFKKLKSGLLKETDHVFGLVDGTKSDLIGIVKNVEVHIERLKLLDDFYVIDMDKDPATPLLIEKGFLATANVVIDCKKAKIAVGEEVTRSIFRVKEISLDDKEIPYWTTLVVPMTLSTAWKILNKPLLNMHPRVPIKREDLHLNLSVLEVLAHAPIYNAMLDKYMKSLELGKNRSAFVQVEVSAKMKDPGLFTLPCRLGDSKPFDTLAGLGSCVNIIPLYLFKKLNIGLLEETDHIFELADGTKSYPVGIVKDVEVRIGKLKLLYLRCDFMVLEDTTSVIDHDLGSIVFEKPFVEATGLVYDREEGTITFEKDKEKIVFKMPHKMEMF
ncbi:MAK10-like protein [Tanacetum coccineum]